MRRHLVALLFLSLIVAPPDLRAQAAAGIRWTAPAGWKAEAARPTRAATYTIPTAAGAGPAECVVNYFGPGQGGTVAANVERWTSQVLGANGKPAPAKVTTRRVRGITITIVDSSGAYAGMGGPMVSNPKPVAGYRLLGAIAEGPQGNVFFKFTGPSRVVAGQQEAFDRLLASIQPE